MTPEAPMPYTESAQDKKWKAESDVRTLIEAGEIKKDKKRYKAAMACAKEQQKNLEYIGMAPSDMGKMSMKQYGKARTARSSKNMASGMGYA